MLLRRFGSTVGAVEPHFEAAAFNEVAFVRKPGFTLSSQEFQEQYEPGGEVELTSEAAGHVKIEAERALLELLAHRIREAQNALGEGEVLLIESTPGRDYPRMRERTENVVEDDHNRLHFYYWFDPPLRLRVYRHR